MKRTLGALSVLVCLLGVGLDSHAAAPARQFPYTKQTALLPGAYQFVFSLWSSPTSTTPLWTSEAVSLTLKTPLLVYNLGSGTVKIPATIDFSQQLFVKVVKTSPTPSAVLANRERLPIVPYALWSGQTGDAGLPDCPAGQVLLSKGASRWACGLFCTDAFVDPQTDPANCGGCGVDCGGGACEAGVCVECAPGCDSLWLGDGFCDDACNVEACEYDGGDCGTGGECAPGCPDEWLGDGLCDPECDVEACNFDNGDC